MTVVMLGVVLDARYQLVNLLSVLLGEGIKSRLDQAGDPFAMLCQFVGVETV